MTHRGPIKRPGTLARRARRITFNGLCMALVAVGLLVLAALALAGVL
jgi:hypothetical protein